MRILRSDWLFPVDLEVDLEAIDGGGGMIVMGLGPLFDRLRTDGADPTIHPPLFTIFVTSRR